MIGPLRSAALLAVLGVLASCVPDQPVRKQLKDACQRNLDCAFGLECVDQSGTSQAGAGQGTGKTCQWHSFGDCEGDGTAPGPNGKPQCLSGQKCRDGHCTVVCAAKADCKDTEVCKIGVCQKGASQAARCYDSRDCPYPESCFYGQCVTRAEAYRCHTDLDCGVGYRCINGLCQ